MTCGLESSSVLWPSGRTDSGASCELTEATGRAHWEVLVRARAIENECYVIAPNQVGKKPRFTAYGHSLIVDPRGKVLAEADGTEQALFTHPSTLTLCRRCERRPLPSKIDGKIFIPSA
mgnify:CR=1 FL=1